jgi:hypothetical protein
MPCRRRAGSGSIWTILTLTIVVVAGCGRGNGRRALEGSVILDGKPLAGATIDFQPAQGNTGGTSGATTDNAGRFSIPAIKGLVPGKYAVTVQKWEGTGRTFKDVRTGAVHEITAPIAFKDADKLEANVAAAGPNRFDFQLISVK